MPKAIDKSHKITYPPGCKEVSEELNKDELLKRLKILARAFQDMGQDENNQYKQIAVYLATEFFMEHQSKDVRLFVACCIADVFRIFAPEAPYSEPGQLKEIFLFLTEQLRGLQDPESPSFKRYFYLLENLSWVKSFNICIELEENQEIFCKLYQLMFHIVNENHSPKVVNFMLDMMCPMIKESDTVTPELLDILLINIIEPHKSQQRCAYNLAKEVIKRTENAIEPYIQGYLNNALMLGKNAETTLSNRLYDLVYELNNIAPSVLLAVLPQLEFKVKSNDVNDRKAVTRLLSKMFSAAEADLAIQNKQLWLCYLGRFNDIDISVRRTCVQSCQDLIVNQPDLVRDVSEALKQRKLDPDENVRMDVIQAIIGAARKDFSSINEELLNCVKERTLDKKFKVRKEALTGLGQIYKRNMQKDDTDKTTIEKIAWVKNKILHSYYQSEMDDKVLVERILNNALVPYNLEAEDRMQRLFHLYGTVDHHAVMALNEIFKTQLKLRKQLRGLLEQHQRGVALTDQNMMNGVQALSTGGLPDPSKAHTYIKKFNEIIHEDNRIRGYLIKLTSPDCSCKKAEECVKEVLKKMGNSIPQNYLYGNVKILMERLAPVMIDTAAISALMKFIEDAVAGDVDVNDDIPKPIESGMKLLLTLATLFPGTFQSEEIFLRLLSAVKQDDDTVSDLAMEVFRYVGGRLEQNYPSIYTSLLPVLQKMVKIGTPKQAKHAIRCIGTLCKNKTAIFEQIFEHLQKNMDLDSPYFLSSLVAIGHISQICPREFGPTVKGIVSKFIVKELLMQDRGLGQKSSESWVRDDHVSEETNAKLQAMKMMVRWLGGMGNDAAQAATAAIRLLYTMVLHEGDLMEKGQVNKGEMARLRLQAGCCMLKLAQEPKFAEKISLGQFQTTALLLNDPCYQVRHEFAQKLHKGLLHLRLPLQYMSIFCLAANDPLKERRQQVKYFLQANISRRREYLKNNITFGRRVFGVLPDYVLPYAIHLLAHDPELQNNEDVATLKNIKECLWFIMEPLMTKTEDYSYNFYRKMIENIKQTKDSQCPESAEANRKMYAVCDLALGIVMTKTANFVLKDSPALPVIPALLFTQPDHSYSNTKNYLPKELQISQLKIPVKKPVPGLSPPCSLSSSSSKPSNGSPTASDNEDSMSESSCTSPPPTNTQQKSLPTSSGAKNISFGFSSPSTSPGQSSGSKIKVIKLPASAAANLIAKGTTPGKSDDKAGTTKDGQQKEDRPPAKGSRAAAATAAAGKKGQGKITDYVSPRPALANKDNKGVTSQDSSSDSPKSSPEKEETGRRRGKRQNSPTVMSTRKRASDESNESRAGKRAKTTTAAAAATKRTSRKVSAEQSANSDASSKSSPKKKTPTDPPRKRGRPRKREPSPENESISSPSPPSSKSSSTTSSPTAVKKRTVTTTKTAVKKNYPIRSNLRRGSSNFQNGTSDGEQGTSESQSPQKTRTRGLRAADNKGEEKLNIKRRKATRR